MVTTEASPRATLDYEAMYREAGGNSAHIPWADLRPHPALVAWLNAIASSVVRCGSRIAVVGCGLGDDAIELIRRGYDVTAFDVSPTAIDWARRLHPDGADCFEVADLFDPPPCWRHRFDLVVEINTIQALSPDLRDPTITAISELVAPHGHLLVICRGADRPAESGPPWPLTTDELRDSAARAGLTPEGTISSFEDDETPPVLRTRALFRRHDSRV